MSSQEGIARQGECGLKLMGQGSRVKFQLSFLCHDHREHISAGIATTTTTATISRRPALCAPSLTHSASGPRVRYKERAKQSAGVFVLCSFGQRV